MCTFIIIQLVRGKKLNSYANKYVSNRATYNEIQGALHRCHIALYLALLAMILLLR